MFANMVQQAHLSGVAFGATYAYLDINRRIWKPLVRFVGGLGRDDDRPAPRGFGELDLDEIVNRLNSSI